MMAVTIQVWPTFGVTRPVLLFENRFAVTHRPEVRQNYDISPDGERFLMIQNKQETTAPNLDVVLNWFEELRRLTAAGR